MIFNGCGLMRTIELHKNTFVQSGTVNKMLLQQFVGNSKTLERTCK